MQMAASKDNTTLLSSDFSIRHLFFCSFPLNQHDRRNTMTILLSTRCRILAKAPLVLMAVMFFSTEWTATTPNAFGQSQVPQDRWEKVTIDEIEIGYGLQIEDVNGDKKPDIILADKSTVQWYENPTWQKHVIAKDLTERDNVCIAARDIDGDGRCEIAVGGQWNYRESVKDGAVHYLIAPSDRSQPWSPVKLYNEPSTHRMHWISGPDGSKRLAVKPLRGKGSVDGDGAGLKLLEYLPPKDPRSDWTHEVICDFLHLSHNFHPVNWDDDPEEELIVAAKEGVWHFDRTRGEGGPSKWKSTQLTSEFAGEIRDGKLPDGKRFIVAIQPMHGSVAAAYREPESNAQTWELCKILSESLKDGHALACADFLGVGYDQIVVGWRAMNDPGVPGIKLFTPLDSNGNHWRENQLSGDEVAVEDIKVGDLDQDGQVDIIAAARQTKNLVILFNRTISPK